MPACDSRTPEVCAARDVRFGLCLNANGAARAASNFAPRATGRAKLSQHREAEARLHEELGRELAGRTPTLEDLPRLKYTTTVVEETMRLYPPAWALSRTATDADTLGDYRVPAGPEALVIPYVTHRHPDFWDEPDRFSPERFAPAAKESRPRFSHLPFGAGPRQCIGQHFAMTELLVIVATLAQRFRLRLAPGSTVEPEASITLRPRAARPNDPA